MMNDWQEPVCLSLSIWHQSCKVFSLTLLHDKLTVTLYHLMMCALQNKSHSSEVYFPSLSFSLSLSPSLFLTVLLCRLEAQSRAAAVKLPLHSASASLSSLLSPVHPGKLNNPMSQFLPLPQLAYFLYNGHGVQDVKGQSFSYIFSIKGTVHIKILPKI